jgi:hypothetical protein
LQVDLEPIQKEMKEKNDYFEKIQFDIYEKKRQIGNKKNER